MKSTAKLTENGIKHQPTDSADKTVSIILLETVGVGLFGILSGTFFSTDHKLLGVWFSFAAAVSLCAIGGTALLKKFGPIKVWILFSVAVVILASLSLAGTKALIKSEQKGHLKLVLKSTSYCPAVNLQLTNDFLFSKEGEVFTRTNIPSFLIVPVPPGESNVNLMFEVINDSALEMEWQEISISVQTNLTTAMVLSREIRAQQPKWKFAEGFNSVGVVSDLRLSPNDSLQLAELAISGDLAVATIIHISMRAKSMPTIFMNFFLACPTSSDREKPELIYAGAGTGTNPVITLPRRNQ